MSRDRHGIDHRAQAEALVAEVRRHLFSNYGSRGIDVVEAALRAAAAEAVREERERRASDIGCQCAMCVARRRRGDPAPTERPR